MNQWMKPLRIVALCFFAVLLTSCGGGGGGNGTPPPPNMNGTWFGTLEDPAGVMHRFSVTISGTSITQIQMDGVTTGQTGSVAQRSAQIFEFTLNDGTEGGFFLDSTVTYAAFVDTDFNFGVVQKGATALPTYANTDINGSWSGIVVTTDFSTFNTGNSTANCTHPTCTVTDSGGPSTATFGTVDPTFGRYVGSTSTSGVAAFLSPDKQFGGSYACTSFAGFPGTCEFTAWKKQ